MNQTKHQALMSHLSKGVRLGSGVTLNSQELKDLVRLLADLNNELATQRDLAEKWKATAEALQQKGISS